MILRFSLILLIPACLALLMTPGVIRFAKRVGAVDLPNERKIHRYPMPRLGGLVIFLSFLLSLSVLFFLNLTFPPDMMIMSYRVLLLAAALLLVLIVGIWDDFRPLSPGRKCVVQVVAATIMYLAGFRIAAVTHPFSTGLLDLGMFDYPVTLLWIVGVTNAFNLIDGLDGLASGVAIIASLTIFTISLLNGDLMTAVLVLALAGALVGFLRYNFNPARIFLGDSGSLFIGFTLAVLSMRSSTKGSTAFAILIPVLALGLPIMDTLVAMTRRFLRSLLPEQPRSESWLHRLHSIFAPDRQHIHHQLMAMGFSHRKVVLLLYVVSCAFGLGAFAVTVTNNVGASLILVAIALATVAGVRQLHYKEMAILQNGTLLPLYEWPVVNRSVFQGFLDLGFIGFAFYIAHLLTVPSPFTGKDGPSFLSHFPVICGVQLAMLSLSGLYQSTIRLVGVGDLLKIVKAVALAVVAAGGVMSLLPQPWNLSNVTTFVIDFYVLLSLVVGVRVSFPVLNYLFRRQINGAPGVLIYGADSRGALLLQQLLNDDSFNLTPLGFLDDNPQLEGKRVNGYPVYGGHWRLPRLLKQYKIGQLLVACEMVKPEILHRLNHIAEQHGLVMKRPKILLEDVSARVYTLPHAALFAPHEAFSSMSVSRS